MNLSKNKIDVADPYSMLRVNLNPLTLAFTGSDKSLEAPSEKPIFQTL